jgi:hypothetical protein
MLSNLVGETLFERTQRSEAEMDNALKLETQRHEAAIRTMHRLRALRLERDAKLK